MAYVYPASDLDRPGNLLAVAGSFWNTTYQGMDFVADVFAARAQLAAQAHLDLLDLLASISRFTVPLYHRENWTFLTFLQSEVNTTAAIATYAAGNSQSYGTGNGLKYGVGQASQGFAIPCPADLHDCKLVLNRITSPSLTLVKDIDFWLREGSIVFREDPFRNALVPTQELFESNEVVDRRAGLWLYHGDYDWSTVYEQFGYALKLQMASSEGYRSLVNALLDAITEGTTVDILYRAWAAITGVPLTLEDGEQVVEIARDARQLCIITDRSVYQFPLGAAEIVTVGDILHAGDPLVDTLRFFEFNRGQTPSAAELSGLVLGPGLLANGYLGELVFENREVPLVVEENVDGHTKVSFAIHGAPLDVDRFWEDVHAKGIQAGQTLAQLLDLRPNPQDEPTADSLPATINPLAFLCANFLRHHAYLIKLRAGYLGTKALGLYTAEQLRKIIPPETVLIVVVELEHAEEPIIMDGPGDATRPGYVEQVSGFPCMVGTETIDGSTMISERLRLYQIRGKCE